jgi:serine/threonine protein kinase
VTSGPSAGKTVRVEGRDRVVIGRSPTATLALDDERASRNHCLIEIDPPRVWVQDLGSRNGTLLADGGAPIQGTVELSGPSQLLIGQSVVAVNVPQATAPRSIRCGRCGNKAPPEVAAEDASAAWVCAMCRTAILDEPIVHPDFEVVRELGRGGMGAVLLAKHKRTGEPRALKVILPQAALSDRARKMFIREAEVQKRLDHPNIVRVDELREVAPGIFCMVMELVEGDDAGTLLERHGPLDPRWVAYLGFHAAAGLAHAHGLGIVHRDIKEDNLLVTRENAVKVADFGLAKSYETSGLSGFTRHGDMAGTLPYMAPEQVTNFRDVKPPGDVYALGATLYRLVTGKFPIQPTPDGNMGAFLLRVLEEPMVPVAQRNPAVPAALAAIIERALDKDTLRRFPSAREMAAALQTM